MITDGYAAMYPGTPMGQMPRELPSIICQRTVTDISIQLRKLTCLLPVPILPLPTAQADHDHQCLPLPSPRTLILTTTKVHNVSCYFSYQIHTKSDIHAYRLSSPSRRPLPHDDAASWRSRRTSHAIRGPACSSGANAGRPCVSMPFASLTAVC